MLGISGLLADGNMYALTEKILKIAGFILASISIYIPIAIYQRHKLHSLFSDYMEEE